MASRHAFYLLCYFLLGDGLKNAYLPAIFGDGHQNMVLLGDLLGVDDLAAVENLLFQLRGVMQLQKQILDGGKVIHSKQVTQQYHVLMTVTEDRWKVRVLQAIP